MTVTCTASVFPEGDWFVIDVHDVGFTQSADREGAEAMAADLVAAVFDLDPSAVRIEMVEGHP